MPASSVTSQHSSLDPSAALNDFPEDPNELHNQNWCFFFKRNNNLYKVLGLGVSNFSWRMLEVIYKTDYRVGGANTILSASFQLALPVAFIRSFVQLAEHQQDWMIKCCKVDAAQFAKICLGTTWHFYIAYMGWDAAYEAGNMVEVDNPFLHFMKNACCSGGGYVVGELIAQSIVKLVRDSYYAIYSDQLQQFSGNTKDHVEQLLELRYDPLTIEQSPGSTGSATHYTQSKKEKKRVYADPWDYTKSFILFFVFAFFSDAVHHIHEHNNEAATGCLQALAIVGALVFCDQALTGLKSAYDTYRHTDKESTTNRDMPLEVGPRVSDRLDQFHNAQRMGGNMPVEIELNPHQNGADQDLIDDQRVSLAHTL